MEKEGKEGTKVKMTWFSQTSYSQLMQRGNALKAISDAEKRVCAE